MDDQSLNNRVAELEQQLAACREAILVLKSTSETSTDHRFRLLFEHSRDVILFIDRETCQILDANTAAVHTYGYTHDELLSLHIQDLRAENTKILTEEQMARADAEGLLFETMHCRKDGSVFPVEVSSQGATIDGKRSLVSVIRDISERKLAEQERQSLIQQIELEKNEAQNRVEELNAIIESMNDPVMAYGKDGFIYKSNASAVEAYGFNPSQQFRDEAVRDMQISRMDGSVVENEDLPSSNALKGIPVIRENFNVTNVLGREMVFQVTSTPLIVNGVQTGAVSVWHDITELKRSEKALQAVLKEAEQGQLMLEVILANLPAGLAVTGGPPDYLVSRVSRYGAEMFRVTEENLIGVPVGLHRLTWGLYLPDGVTRPELEQMPLYRAAYLGEETRNFEFSLEAFNGEKMPISINAAPVRNPNGQIVAAISTWSDITHLKQAEQIAQKHNEALQLSESKFQSIFKNAPFAISLTGKDDGVYVEVNDAWCKLFEYERGEVIGKIPAALNLVGMIESSEQIRTTLERDGCLRDFELKTFSKSNKPLVLFCNIEEVKIGDAPYLLNTIENITERKRTEEALSKYAAELERSNRELQEFAFVASHDLQEPLRKIEAFSDMLLEDSGTFSERQGDLLNRVHNSANRMRSMVVGLLNLSRISTEAQPFQEVDLNQVITEVLSDLERRIQLSGGEVKTGNLPIIEADPLQIRQLFQNLIVNALKFQPPDSKPFVKVFAEQPDNSLVKILIEDNGIGFDDTHAEQIFQPFRRFVSRSEYEGSGIGLAICRKIVERHNGHITVNSQVGQGATFVITLPLKQIELYHFPGIF